MMMRNFPAVSVVATLLAGATIAGCNERVPVFENSIAPTAPTTLVSPVTPLSAISYIELTPNGLNGGGSGRGTVVFDLAVPPEGQTVSLRTSDPAVSVSPQVITMPGGSNRAEFSFTTQSTTTDKRVEIIASTPSESKASPLAVWNGNATMFFAYSSDRGETIGQGRTDKYTSPAAIRVGCSGTGISATISRPDGGTFLLAFGTQNGLRPGTYDVGSSGPSFIRVEGYSFCGQPTSKFTVHDVDFAARGGGKVDRFWVSFEQRCAGRSGVFRGELKVVNPTPFDPHTVVCVGGR